MPNPTCDSLKCFPGKAAYTRSAVLGASTVIELYFGVAKVFKVDLRRFKVKRVSGAAANFTPLLFSEASVTTAGAIQQEYAGAATAVATLFDPVVSGGTMETDENGKLYMVIGPDAGADNVFDYKLRFKINE